MKPFKISGTGCALVDYLYKPVDFSSPSFGRYISKSPGDGGLFPGKLVFTEELEKLSGKDYTHIRKEITASMEPIAVNIGGPSVVSLIHTAQMLAGMGHEAEVRFYGCRGNDHAGQFIREKLASTPLKKGHYKVVRRHSPFTDVLIDPLYDDGHGERIFINNIGAAGEMLPDDLDNDFFNSQIVVFGATALVPALHNSLKDLLHRARANGAITIVNTVFDFLSEKMEPDQPWPMGGCHNSYSLIDLLITNHEEALRHSGKKNMEAALAYFREKGVGAMIITHGHNPVTFFSNGNIFGKMKTTQLPVSQKVVDDITKNPALAGDTTGCGDNFTGGVIASIAIQAIQREKNIHLLLPPRQNDNGHITLDMVTAVAFGVASGGFTRYYDGGTWFEKYPGEKAEFVMKLFDDYLKQIHETI